MPESLRKPGTKDWSLIPTDRALRELRVDPKSGLLSNEIAERKERYGQNVLVERRGIGATGKVLKQFQSPLVLILVVAGAVTALLGEYVDASIIGFAVLVNIVIGFFQEERANRAFALLRGSETKTATVMRDADKRLISAEDVVVGDILVLESGMRVPADARILSTQGIQVNESPLTGEWADVEKRTDTIPTVTPIAEQFNMIFSGTSISGGVGSAVVTAVGKETQFGRIAESLVSVNEETPLERRMKKLAGVIALLVGLILVAIFALGVLRGETWLNMLFISVAIAIAAIPEGLPAAVTVVLAIGMESILRRGGLVRNLLTAETLGSTTVILADKTGTLTKGEMRVASLVTLRSLPTRDTGLPEMPKERVHDEEDMVTMGILASDAFIEHEGEAMKDWVVRGRPVERAVVLAGLERGLHPKELAKEFPRVDFLPFSSKQRFVASLHRVKHFHSYFVYFSGAPDELLKWSTHLHVDGQREEKTSSAEKALLREEARLTKEGMRLIGIAYLPGFAKEFSEDVRKDPSLLLQKGLTYTGFIALHDPIRDEAHEAIQKARKAGVTVMMVTGDHPDTARAIAHVAGIADGHASPVYTGRDIEKLTDVELIATLRHARVFARMLPEDKLRIARVLQSQKEVVAMTGDGINDAPTLRGANIGIAVGSATEVAKESADLVLLENGMSVIVAAIEEGRRMFDNLRKITLYLLSTSFGEIVLIGGALWAGLPIPLLPGQIIWTNMVTEGLMNFAFAFEPAEEGIMKRHPKGEDVREILTGRLYALLWAVGVGSGLLLFGFYRYLVGEGYEIETIRTMMFLLLSVGTLAAAISFKDIKTPIWNIHLFTNRAFWISLSLSLLLLFVAFLVPPLAKVLSLEPLSSALPYHVLLLGVVATVVMVEILKRVFIERRFVR